jgi:hypothetical protein
MNLDEYYSEIRRQIKINRALQAYFDCYRMPTWIILEHR